MDSPTAPEPTPRPYSRGGPSYVRIALGVVALAGIIYLGRSGGAYVPRFAEWVGGLGALGPIAFIVGYAVAVVAFIPGSFLTLASGAIFGVAEGTVYVFVAAVLGSALAFLIARHGARASIERRIEGDIRFVAIDQAVGLEGRKIVFLLRLSPVFPFNLLNYALGLTQVRLADYLIASIGMLPGTLLYVYTGKLAGDVAAIAGGAETTRGLVEWSILSVGFVATLGVTFYVTRLAKRALDAATNAEETFPPSR
ncbi:MAG: TVP38/TMEM64 family protein [bacterium]|nr:hypothetical protein [Deltaproteobacteria bacterium]MCP4903785.1 TVP38/TMEM64 family protein [bacterium]